MLAGALQVLLVAAPLPLAPRPLLLEVPLQRYPCLLQLVPPRRPCLCLCLFPDQTETVWQAYQNPGIPGCA